MTVHAKPCGFRTYLGNRFAIPTFPPPRRLLDSFHTKSRKELSSAIPSGLLQAHSSIRKDSRVPFPLKRSKHSIFKQLRPATRHSREPCCAGYSAEHARHLQSLFLCPSPSLEF